MLIKLPEQSCERKSRIRTYSDWRELFEKEGDKIDSVNVTVPDHMYFPIAFNAVKNKNMFTVRNLYVMTSQR